MFPLAAIAGGALSGGLSYLGQREANEANRDIASQTTAANMAEAQRNRDFQREMSNTAFQRQMEDLKRANLNPLLAAGMSGASTPGGSAGSAVSADMKNTLGGATDAVQTAIGIHNQQLASAKQATEIGLMKDNQNLYKAQATKAAMETKVMSKGIPEADVKNKIYNWFNKFVSDTNKASAKQPDELTKAFDNTLNKYKVKMKGPK